jgi:hypothetical protein
VLDNCDLIYFGNNKWSTDKDERLLEVKETEANE